MEPVAAARQLERTLGSNRGPITVADAATRSGLALRDAERGLHWLTKEYRGHLRVTKDGDLLFLFPHGFSKPWVVPTAMGNAARAAGRGVSKVARFVVRAWLTIVTVIYVVAFLALLVVLLVGSAAGQGDRRDSKSSNGLLNVMGGLLRVLGDMLFWSAWMRPYGYGTYGRPFEVEDRGSRGERRAREEEAEKNKDRTPFHERVNRYVFGPPSPPDVTNERERAILAEIRAGKGRIGLADVMRVTGLPREQVDSMMARLMLDYEGEVDVSEDGGIAYRFEALRKTAESGAAAAANARTAHIPDPPWTLPAPKPPLTGNPAGSNAIIIALNGFNLLMGWFAFSSHLTVENIQNLIHGVPLQALPPVGTPVLLGLIPMLFSLAILLAPALRAPVLPIQRARTRFENGRRAVTNAILSRVRAKRPVQQSELMDAWKRATGEPPEEKTLTRVVVSLGGDVDLENSQQATSTAGVRYRFDELELEAAAVEAERREAKEEEARVGEVVFATDR